MSYQLHAMGFTLCAMLSALCAICFALLTVMGNPYFIGSSRIKEWQKTRPDPLIRKMLCKKDGVLI